MTAADTIGQAAAARIEAAAAAAMVKEIAEAGGREVFFAGHVNRAGLVASVRVCARGTEGAVPAFLESLKSGEVVLHNHPSGDIAPSEADLRVATLFGFHGHGVYIVDNAVERAYVVVEPFQETEKEKLGPEEAASLLKPESAMARVLPHYEERPQQIRLLEAAIRAFNHDGMAVVEAPTGVGKTMAYLIPAVLWAVRNNERVVISTNTINLQEQLMEKDIPLLRKCLDVPFSAVLVKGRGNYLCRRKLERAQSEATLFDDEGDQDALAAIAEWAGTTEDGSLADLPFAPERELWSRVCSEAETCSFAHCPDPRRCFVGKARRDVAKANIIVVNHHMLFSDLAIKKEIGSFSSLAVLPAFNRLILDEAHNIEDSATSYFGLTITRMGALSLIGRFVRAERGQERGLAPYLKLKLAQLNPPPPAAHAVPILDLIDHKLLPALAAAREALKTAFAAVRSHVADQCGQTGRDIRWRLTQQALADPGLREIHAVYVLPAAEEVLTCAQLSERLAKALRKLPAGTEEGEHPLITEILQLEGYRDRLTRLHTGLSLMTSAEVEPNTVRWAEIDAANDGVVRLSRCPLEVGENLAEWVYDNLDTVVMTSATLTVEHDFGFFQSRVGISRMEDKNVEETALSSPFDFGEQALFGIPTDLPEPSDPAFGPASIEAIGRILEASGGRAFVLFTSYYALENAYRALEPELKGRGIKALKQGGENRTRLLDRFRDGGPSVLFATDSFWEGVDVAGAALQCVILPKLPFRVPTEPVFEARVEAIEARGGNAFMEYTVPQAVIRFRQGFGRLIRRKDDRGVIAVLDRRIITKRYGRMFIDSLPSVRTVKGPSKAVYAALGRFFADGEEAVAPGGR